MTFELRVPTEEDAYIWHELFADPEVMEFHGGAPHDLSVYAELTARQRAHDATRGFCMWTLLAEGGTPAGYVGAQPWPHQWGPAGEIEIGWRLGRAHWGKGYATRAGEETLRRLKAAGVPRVVAMVDAANARSIAVIERLGMELTEHLTTPRGGAARRYGLVLG